jgi:plasmid stabilization system protein ParE
MAEDPKRIVELTDRAKLDIAVVDFSTASVWGEAQAERYLLFLRYEFEILAENPTFGMPLNDFEGLRSYTAKLMPKRTAFGHRILYRETKAGIRIIRVLHSATNWPEGMDLSE